MKLTDLTEDNGHSFTPTAQAYFNCFQVGYQVSLPTAKLAELPPEEIRLLGKGIDDRQIVAPLLWRLAQLLHTQGCLLRQGVLHEGLLPLLIAIVAMPTGRQIAEDYAADNGMLEDLAERTFPIPLDNARDFFAMLTETEHFDHSPAEMIVAFDLGTVTAAETYHNLIHNKETIPYALNMDTPETLEAVIQKLSNRLIPKPEMSPPELSHLTADIATVLTTMMKHIDPAAQN